MHILAQKLALVPHMHVIRNDFNLIDKGENDVCTIGVYHGDGPLHGWMQ